MKYSIHGLILIWLLLSGCQTETGKDIKKDSITSSTTIPVIPPAAGDLVKSEAPDAVTKTEQGYAMPRYDEGEGQSPVNILSDSLENDQSHIITVKFNTTINAVENLGHTIQVDFANGSTSEAGEKCIPPNNFTSILHPNT